MTTSPKTIKRRRKRGVILTKVGLARFQAAKTESEYDQNRGNRYTLEVLSEKTGVSMDTLAKVFGCEVRVDKQTLKCCFRAFSLELTTGDYYSPEACLNTAYNIKTAHTQTHHTEIVGNKTYLASTARTEVTPVEVAPVDIALDINRLETNKSQISSTPINRSGIRSAQASEAVVSTSPAISHIMPQPPGGQLPANSPFYIPNPKIETISYQAIEHPGALIRLKGAHQTGKTSLMERISQQARRQNYQPVYISFQLAENTVLQDLDQLLKWFCASVGLGLSMKPDLAAYWDPIFGSKMSCKFYFEEYLLPALQQPMVLFLDDVERLFNNTEVADEFFGLIRTCYEEAKTSQLWQQLRIVIAQTSEVYIPLNINKSPFNVGVAIPLSPFSERQLQALATTYQLHWSVAETSALYQLLNGQPYLTHLVAYHVWKGDITVAAVIEQGIECPVFLAYFQQQQQRLQQKPELKKVLAQLLGHSPVSSDAIAHIYRLQSLGLVILKESGPQLANQLLTDYFSAALSQSANAA